MSKSILNSKRARQAFLKHDTAAAKKILEAEDITPDSLKNVTYEMLANELSKRMFDIKDIKGIRIRQGNILIGDENTLRKCYKEERFNSWMVGELLVFNEDIIPNTRRDDYEKNSAYKELLSQFTEWANEMSRQIRHRSYERSLTQSDKKFLADESVTDVDGVDISLGTELDSYDMDDSDSVANTDLLSKLSLLMDMGKKKTKYNVLNLNSKFTVDQKQTLEHVFDALYAKYTNAKANDIIQTIIDSF